jgi:hypothetical protein
MEFNIIPKIDTIVGCDKSRHSITERVTKVSNQEMICASRENFHA